VRERVRWLLLPAIVGASTLVHWLAGRRFDGFWIMPDEAIYARRGVDLWQHGQLSIFHGEGAGYGILYPLLVGLPLSVGNFATGYHSLKLLQALVVSLAAVPVAAWGRRLMPMPWAAVAVVLTLLSPLLLYSGLVMTEVLFYPLAALALFAIAVAVERATPRFQLLALAAIAAAVLTRTQGVIFVAVFAAAVVLDAAFARDFRHLRRFLPLWAVLAATIVVALAYPRAFGSYAGVVRGSYPIGSGLRLTLEHAGWIAVSTGVIPAAALVLLALDAVRGREQSAAVRAFVAVALATIVLVATQIGFFAARWAPHLLERDLAPVPPVLFLALALWLARAAPRPRIVTGVVAFVVLACIVALPWDDLVATDALPDSFSLVILDRLRPHDPNAVVTVVAAVLLGAFAFVPRRLRLVLPVLVAAVLISASVVSANNVADRVRYDQVNLVGTPRDWVDAASHGQPVTYVYDGETYWNGVWQATIWNSSINRVVALAPSRVPGPIPQQQRAPAPDGSLGLDNPYVVASDPHTFRGAPVAHIDQKDVEVAGLTLWRVDRPTRLSTVTRGVRPEGDMIEPAQITVYDCAGGRLEMTLLPKETKVVTVLLDGHVATRAKIGGLPYWNGTVEVPQSPSTRVCHFTILGESLLGSTRIEFVRR
jgi:hypothetical protein